MRRAKPYHVVPHAARGRERVPTAQSEDFPTPLADAPQQSGRAGRGVAGREGEVQGRRTGGPKRDPVVQRVHQHRRAVSALQVPLGDAPHLQRNTGPSRDLVRDPLRDAGVRLAVRRERAKDEEKVQVRVGACLATGVGAEQKNPPQLGGDSRADAVQERPYGRAPPGRERRFRTRSQRAGARASRLPNASSSGMANDFPSASDARFSSARTSPRGRRVMSYPAPISAW